MQEHVAEINRLLTLLKVRIPSPAIKFQLFHRCIQLKSEYIQTAAGWLSDTFYANRLCYSNFSVSLQATYKSFFWELLLIPELPDFSWNLLTTPLRMGGGGIRDPQVTGVSSVIRPHVRHLHTIEQGILLPNYFRLVVDEDGEPVREVPTPKRVPVSPELRALCKTNTYFTSLREAKAAELVLCLAAACRPRGPLLSKLLLWIPSSSYNVVGTQERRRVFGTATE